MSVFFVETVNFYHPQQLFLNFEQLKSSHLKVIDKNLKILKLGFWTQEQNRIFDPNNKVSSKISEQKQASFVIRHKVFIKKCLSSALG